MSELSGPENQAAMTRFVMNRGWRNSPFGRPTATGELTTNSAPKQSAQEAHHDSASKDPSEDQSKSRQ
jgi:hypothetical protein